jgi:iron complex transport system ATP-binding protein
MTDLLEASAVSFSIGAATLLDRVSLTVGAGETVALVGPNGAGKSTLLRILAGELRRYEGMVRLKGADILDCNPGELAQHRAVLSQSISITFPFTVAEIVRMGAGDRRGAAVEARIDAALADVDLLAFRERIITTLSGGEQSRAHFARVMVQLACGEEKFGPGVLLLDEPTASLDLRHQIDMAAAARKCAARGVGVVAVLHDLNISTVFADRVIVLNHGRVDASGPPEITITDAVLERVFGVSGAVGRAPPAGTPFVLPHAARSVARR